MTDIYSAGEDPIEGIDANSLADSIGRHLKRPESVRYAGDLAQAKATLIEAIREGDLILCLGAGSITRLAEQVAVEMGTRFP
jgi:UDP-N-acetylmuramate--alanine ligase